MDWFEQLTGFPEEGYAETQARVRVENGRLTSTESQKSYTIGRLTIPSLAEIIESTLSAPNRQRTIVGCEYGNVRDLHSDPGFGGALFQVASQFNLLEMSSSQVTPEDGLARYAFDRTQGPACAIAAGAATIYRNYLIPLDGGIGQTSTRQVNTLSDVGQALETLTGVPTSDLWEMRNGYALCTASGLEAINAVLGTDGGGSLRDELRSHLRIGIHRDVEVTCGDTPGPLVSQIFCSAVPVYVYEAPESAFEPFATMVLEAAYEATLLEASRQHADGGSNIVLLTRLGGGAFHNPDNWIDSAILRALKRVEHAGLDVRLVCYGIGTGRMEEITETWKLASSPT